MKDSLLGVCLCGGVAVAQVLNGGARYKHKCACTCVHLRMYQSRVFMCVCLHACTRVVLVFVSACVHSCTRAEHACVCGGGCVLDKRSKDGRGHGSIVCMCARWDCDKRAVPI